MIRILNATLVTLAIILTACSSEAPVVVPFEAPLFEHPGDEFDGGIEGGLVIEQICATCATQIKGGYRYLPWCAEHHEDDYAALASCVCWVHPQHSDACAQTICSGTAASAQCLEDLKTSPCADYAATCQ